VISFDAAVLDECRTDRPFSESRPLAIQPVEAEGPSVGEVLVRVRAASLCRSDLSVITGVRAWPMPIVPGHEASGVVEEVGAGVAGLAPGDQVVMVFQPGCRTCPRCRAGDIHLCEPGLAANRAGRLLGGGPRLRRDGEPLHHHMGLSAFAQMAVVSERSVVKVDPGLPAEVAALFGCAAMCGAGSVTNTGGVTAGETVAIVGVGGVGASAILGARLAGAGRIIAVDPDEDKREIALALGATDVLESGVESADQIKDLTGGGVDCALESAGVLEAVEIAYSSTRRGGRVVVVGLVSPSTPLSLDLASHVTGAKSIIGSYMGSCNPAVDIPRYVELYQEGRFPVDRLITHQLPLTDINIALERMASAGALRQIVWPSRAIS
jgi:alcohol dehydrogenase